MGEKRVTVFRSYEEQPESQYAIITDVPALVCHQCGERAYTPDVVDRLQSLSKLIRKGATPPKTTEVPVFSLQEVKE